jgi:hypothetical protein
MNTPALKKRDFESYFLEYQLMSTEVEINAYWKRMDEIITNMSDEEKTIFFKQLDVSLTKEIMASKKLRAQVEALLKKEKAKPKPIRKAANLPTT